MRRLLAFTFVAVLGGMFFTAQSAEAQSPTCDRVALNDAMMEARLEAEIAPTGDRTGLWMERVQILLRQHCPSLANGTAPVSPVGQAVETVKDLMRPFGMSGPTDPARVGDSNPIPEQLKAQDQIDNPGGAMLFGTNPNASFPCGWDFMRDDLSIIYMASCVGEFYHVDPVTGSVTVVGQTGQLVRGMSYDPVTDLLYILSDPGGLYTVDETNGQATLAVQISGANSLLDISFDSTGSLWGYDQGDNLLQIDPGTGAATVIGSTGLSWAVDFGSSMDHDPEDGALYLAAWDTNSGNSGNLFEVDPGTGGTTNLGAYVASAGIGIMAQFAVELPWILGAQEAVVPVDPNRQLGGQVHLPILNFQGQDDVCRTWIEVQYIGCDPSKAVLVTWGEPGFCPPQAAGPLKVECTGLLQYGSTWNLLGAQIPTGSKSGILFKFTAKQLSDVGLDDDLGFDDVVADLMCETLFFGVVGDSDDYRRFKKAYNEGLDFAGINQRIAAGDGVLAVEVLRHCPGDVTPGVEVSSRYNGIAGTHLGHYDPIFGGHGYYVPLIYAEKAGLNTVMYIQNGGLECSSVEIWFKAQDDCLRARICEIFTLAPGETYQWDASDCVGPDWQGSAWLRSSQVMGIAVDIFGRDILMTYTAEPQPFSYVITDADGEPEVVESVTTGEKVAFGPLMYSEYQGWDTGVQVMNLSEIYNAKVKVYFLDRSGDVITTLVDWVCPRGSQTFFLPVIADLPGTWVGSIRIESQDWWTPGTNPIDAPNIVGVATLMKYSDAARTDTQEAIAYNLLPEHKSYIWQIGSGGGGTVSGVGLIAIPSLLKDLDGTGTTSEVAIMNLVAKPGFTDFAIYIYDQNGLLDFVCQKLHSRQVEYIDLQTWGYVNNGFKGSAIISATFWEHDVFGPTGDFVRNLVGLGAVGVERTGTRLGEDVPGDEAAGSRGIPFERARNLDVCLGGFTPRCPGQPIWDPMP